MSLLSVVLVHLAAAAAGCVVSPQPSPPTTPPILDGDGIGLGPDPEVTSNFLTFEADPGTVEPAEGIVVVTNLDTADAPSFAQVREDGSFAIAVPGEPGQTFRFQAKRGDQRSEPADLTVDPLGLGVSSTMAGLLCLEIEPARWLALDDAADARDAVIRNRCDEAVAIDPPRLRRGLGPFTFSPTGALTIEPGGSAVLSVRAGGGGDEREDVLLFDITAPASERRSLTLTLPD